MDQGPRQQLQSKRETFLMKSLPLEFQSANISKFLYDWHLYMKEMEDLTFVAILYEIYEQIFVGKFINFI